MQVKRTEAAEKPKGMIERNQSLDNLNSDTLESKVDATIKHSAENGLKTSGNIVNEEFDEKTKYVAAQRAKLINEENVDSKPEQAVYDEYYKRQLEVSTEENESEQDFMAQKSGQDFVQDTSASDSRDIFREQFVHNKRIRTSDEKSESRKGKTADITEYEIKSEGKSFNLYQKDLDKKTRKLLSKGEVEEKTNSRIKTGQEKSVSDRADVLKSDHDSVKKFKYYRSSNGQIQSKVEYNRQLLKKVEPKDINKLSIHELSNQRRIKSINREAVSAFEKDNESWEQYRNDPNARNAKLYRKAHNNYIGVLKNKYSAEELASGNFIEFGNKKVRVLTKVSFEGNIDDLKKTIKLDKRSYRKLRSHLRFKKLSKASASVLGKLISLSAVSLPKATLRSGLNYINSKAKNVNIDDTSETGIESAKMMYRAGSEAKGVVSGVRHIATSVKKHIQTFANNARPAYSTGRSLYSKIQSVPMSGRNIATAVEISPYTSTNRPYRYAGNVAPKTREVNLGAKRAAQNAKKAVKQAQKTAQKAVETTKKAAQAAEKVAEVTFKAIAKAATFFVTHLPIILIVSLVLIVLFLIVAVASGLISAVSDTTIAGVSYVFPNEETTAEDVSNTIEEYKKLIDDKLKSTIEENIEKANAFLSADDDAYGAYGSPIKIDWIRYNGGSGEVIVRQVFDNMSIDYAEYFSLLYIYLQKQKNNSDGNNAKDIYSFTFTENDLMDFFEIYFDVSYFEETGVECPGRNCKTSFCTPPCSTRTITTTISTEDGPKTITQSIPYCPGHPYCDAHHNKASIEIAKSSNIMDKLGFTQEEKDWEKMVEQLYDSYIMGYVLKNDEIDTEEVDPS
ncbi:MAG: hypothetical protein IK990_00320 [Ruminiclostridium sp.]|nr:hypothetical protein [Ruminiclostridium sp.]